MFQSLPGFREFYPEDCAVRNLVFAHWRDVCACAAFQEFDGPVLEPLELLTAKSGPEITGQLFNFEDKGGRQVTLRPEMTPTLARMVAARAGGLRRPVRWFSIGEHFRYEKQQKGRLRSFYQLNADILGEPGVGADAEVIALLVHVLRSFGLGEGDFVVRLSDRDLWLLWLEGRGLVGEAASAALGIIDKLERESGETLSAKLAEAGACDGAALLDGVRTLAACRSLSEIRAFFEKETTASPEVVSRVSARLASWASLLELLEAMGAGQFVRVDPGIVRGLAYYTGFVFEAFQTVGKGRALAGGGRYDHLVEKLGGPEFPAVGFGMGDVTLRDLLELKGLMPQPQPALDAWVVIGGAAERPSALSLAAVLRAGGLRVDYSLKDTGFGKQFRMADQSGARFAVICGSDEVAQGGAKVKDLKAGDEVFYRREELLEALRAKLA